MHIYIPLNQNSPQSCVLPVLHDHAVYTTALFSIIIADISLFSNIDTGPHFRTALNFSDFCWPRFDYSTQLISLVS